MANALYAKGKEKILSGAIDLTTATIKAALLSSSYTANLSTDEFWSGIPAIAGAVEACVALDAAGYELVCVGVSSFSVQ